MFRLLWVSSVITVFSLLLGVKRKFKRALTLSNMQILEDSRFLLFDMFFSFEDKSTKIFLMTAVL